MRRRLERLSGAVGNMVMAPSDSARGDLPCCLGGLRPFGLSKGSTNFIDVSSGIVQRDWVLLVASIALRKGFLSESSTDWWPAPALTSISARRPTTRLRPFFVGKARLPVRPHSDRSAAVVALIQSKGGLGEGISRVGADGAPKASSFPTSFPHGRRHSAPGGFSLALG